MIVTFSKSASGMGGIQMATIRDWPNDYRFPKLDERISLMYRPGDIKLTGSRTSETFPEDEGFISIYGTVEAVTYFREYENDTDLDPKWSSVIHII